MGRKDGNSGTARKVLKIAGWTLFSFFSLLVIAILCLCAYFTPARITEIVNKEIEKNVKADITLSGLDYSVFSSWPWLVIHLDSISVKSKSLEGDTTSLPKLQYEPSFLASTGFVKAKINLLKLINGKVFVDGIEIEKPIVNIVMINDSLNNFNILPPIKEKIKMPEISLGDIRIVPPLKFDLYDAEKEARINTRIDLFDFIKKNKNRWDIALSVEASGGIGEFSLPVAIPLSLNGEVGFDYDSISFDLKDFKLQLPFLSALLNLAGKASDSLLDISDLNINLSMNDIFGILKYVPEDLIPPTLPLEDINGNLSLDMDVDMESPCMFDMVKDSILSIPSLALNLNIPQGEIIYEGKNMAPVRIENLSLMVNADYDSEKPQESFLRIPYLRFFSHGVSADVALSLNNIFDSAPGIEGSANIDANISSAAREVLQSMGIKASGDILARVGFSALIEDYSPMKLADIKADMKVSSKSVNAGNASAQLSAAIKGLNLELKAALPTLEQGTSLNKGSFNLITGIAGVNIREGNAEDIIFNDLKLNGELKARPVNGTTSLSGDLDFTLGGILMKSAGMKVNLQGLESDVSMAMLSSPITSASSWSPPLIEGDGAIIEKRVEHTPLYLVPGENGGGMLTSLLPMISLDGELKIKSGSFETDSYIAQNSFSDIDIYTNIDSLEIRSLKARSDDTGLSLSGKISGLRNFITSSSPSLLNIDLDAYFDNVDINRLSGAYYAGVEKQTGKPYDFNMPPLGPFTAADSLCVMIPRNLQADIRLRSRSAEYMDFKFAPLSTDITLRDGVAKLGNLSVGTTYADVSVDWIYSTANFDDIFMQLDMNLRKFDFSDFFTAFPSLVEKMPEVKNLSGWISATADGKFHMFPSMFMDFPSTRARFDLQGHDLNFAREGRIEKITHLLQIKGSEPIGITGIDVKGAVRDNLLLLKPFDIKFGGYEIGVAGVNNMQGEMYYHVALKRSPFHMPFGVNFVGYYRHPSIRLGGTEIKDGREREIAADLNCDVNINIMQQLKHGWQIFVETAAEYDLRKK